MQKIWDKYKMQRKETMQATFQIHHFPATLFQSKYRFKQYNMFFSVEREKRERSGEAYRLRLKGYKTNISEQKQRRGKKHKEKYKFQASKHKPSPA